MEIVIDLPAFAHPFLEWIGGWLAFLAEWWNRSLAALVAARSAAWSALVRLPHGNVLLPVTALLLVFWPLLLTSVMAVVAAWGWIFWLCTSMVLGILQLLYATYQFFMIALDIAGLSVLKSYTVVRRQAVHFWFGGHVRQGRRRLWRQRLDEAGTYENFLKIRIEPKDVTNSLKDERVGKEKSLQKIDAALPDAAPPATGPVKKKLRRSSSFSVDSSSPTRGGGGSPPTIPRNRSFSGEHLLQMLKERTDPVVAQELGPRVADLLVTTTWRLQEARLACIEDATNAEAASALAYLLTGVVKRNHLTLDDILVENARSIAATGQYGLSQQSRQIIRSYYEEVEKGLDWIAEAEERDRVTVTPLSGHDSLGEISLPEPTRPELSDRIMLVRKMKQNMGRTALMLSGGGAQAMYHLGVVRALIESKVYNDIKVISGTSGGSITAAMCAIKRPDELYADVCVPTVSTDYMLTGEMKRRNIRWFPPMLDMAAYWLKNKLLVDSKYFQRTCEFYYQDITFEEAFERTGKHVCITVSASRASGDTAQRLLLNHISTPHVTIASAVRASCALPGVMAPATLMAKNSKGELEPFEVDGVEWIDGSVQADLPFQRIATLFAVTTFVVSQTNFHIVPFLNKAHHPNPKSLYWRLFQTVEWDIRSRALKLSRLGLFPRIFGQDISKVFKQKYHGNMTIVPRFTTMQTFGLQALSNPTVEDMEGYLKYGQIATWPFLNAIRDMLRLEKALDDCLARLEGRMRCLHPDFERSNTDDVESISSSVAASSGGGHRVRIVGPPPIGMSLRETERMRQKVTGLEHENESLRQEIRRLQKLLTEQGLDAGRMVIETRQERNERGSERSLLSEGSEGAIWNLMRNSLK
jgi:predicted acylesterase/phospholipase RssA